MSLTVNREKLKYTKEELIEIIRKLESVFIEKDGYCLNCRSTRDIAWLQALLETKDLKFKNPHYIERIISCIEKGLDPHDLQGSHYPGIIKEKPCAGEIEKKKNPLENRF